MPKKLDVAEVINGEVFIHKPGTPVWRKTDDLCRRFGKSRQWIARLTQQGVLTKHRTQFGDLYLDEEAVKAYIAMLEARDDDKDEDDEKADALKRKSEAQFKKAKATIATLDAKERMGIMHRSEDVEAMTEDLIYSIRSALVALPGRLAVDVMEAKDSAEASDIIRTEIYKVMEELANYKYDPAKYQERVRERLRLEALSENDSE